jgi:hypothetical protein
VEWRARKVKQRPASRAVRLQWRPFSNTSDLDAVVVVLALLEAAPISFVGGVAMKVISLHWRQLPLFIQTPTAPESRRRSTLVTKLIPHVSHHKRSNLSFERKQ